MSATPKETLQNIYASSKHLADEMDPHSDAVSRSVKNLQDQISLLRTQMQGSRGWSKDSLGNDVDFLQSEISRMKAAAEIPAKNWNKIGSILEGLHRAAIAAGRPQNSHLAPKIKEITSKVAGLFQEIDTTEDLNKPLEQIEKAVHALYGDQSSNKIWYDLSKKGKHTKKDLSKE